MNCEILDYVTKIEKLPVVCNGNCVNCRIVRMDKYFPRRRIDNERARAGGDSSKSTPHLNILELIEKAGK